MARFTYRLRGEELVIENNHPGPTDYAAKLNGQPIDLARAYELADEWKDEIPREAERNGIRRW